MQTKFESYSYSKLYIFIEDEDNKIAKRLSSDEFLENDDYQYKIVTSVSQRELNNDIFHLIQYEDKQLGWINLEKSVQIFRFPAKHYQVIESVFQPNELNEKMNISKDFIAHFQGKLLNIKSQITYNNEIYYSVFIKNKFHGFHKSEYLDPIIEIDETIEPENITKELSLFKFSNLTGEQEKINDIDTLKIISIFKVNGIAKVLVNGDQNFWVSIDELPKLKSKLIATKMSVEHLHFEDLVYSINDERTKTKEILKSVLSAKEFLNSNKKGSAKIEIKSQMKIEELNEELVRMRKDNEDLSVQVDRLTSESKLAKQRLEHQLDFRGRLEKQKDKYKERMDIVNEKLKDLDMKYKSLKEKYDKR